jgi:hypothetical protein
MDLKSDDKHNMQLDPKHVPVPIVNGRRHSMFRLPVSLRIVCVSNFVNCLSINLLPTLFQLSQAPRERKTPPYSC